MIRSGKIKLNVSDEEAELICPRCGGVNLHHVGVTLFERSEDGDPLVRIKVAGSTVATDVVRSGEADNPSPRRHGLAIQFTCETCNGSEQPDVIELTIAQHKGTTFLGWRFEPAVKN